MFARLDTSGDLFLEAAELAAINLDKYEVCIRAFFNSCDTSKDGRVSAPEWCFCFWRESALRGRAWGVWGWGGACCGERGCTPRAWRAGGRWMLRGLGEDANRGWVGCTPWGGGL